MLDQLPVEILQRIFYYVDQKPYGKVPDHHFYYPSATLLPFTQVNQYLRDAIAPLLFYHTSLVREYELSSPTSRIYERAYDKWMKLKYATKYVQELEIPNTMPFSELDGVEKRIKSLTILGHNEYCFDSGELCLEHLAVLLPKTPFEVKGLRRLDLLIDTTALQDLSALKSFEECHIEELNITIRNLPTVILFKQFLNLLKCLRPSLKKLTIRYAQQQQPSSLGLSQHEAPEHPKEFIKCLNSLDLTHFSIDLYYVMSRVLITHVLPLQRGPKKPLVFTMREPSLAGNFTNAEFTSILSFLHCLNSYRVQTLNFAFGVQTELPYHTSLSILQHLLKAGYERSKEEVQGIQTVGTHMIWNIIDDSLFMESSRSKEHPILSYQTDAHYSPSFRILENYKVNVTENSLFLVRKGQETDYEFWSAENISINLLKFSKFKRSTLWD